MSSSTTSSLFHPSRYHALDSFEENLKKARMEEDTLPIPKDITPIVFSKTGNSHPIFTPPKDPLNAIVYTQRFNIFYQRIPTITHFKPELFTLLEAQETSLSDQRSTGPIAIKMLLQDRKITMNIEDESIEHATWQDLQKILNNHHLGAEHLTFPIGKNFDTPQLSAQIQDLFEKKGGPLLMEAHNPSRWVILDSHVIESTNTQIPQFMIRDPYFGVGCIRKLHKIIQIPSETSNIHAFRIL
ncbi:MAG: hypothetical protein WCP39_01500 [Chlamydiota bacterium]